jgi:hypothetical protein
MASFSVSSKRLLDRELLICTPPDFGGVQSGKKLRDSELRLTAKRGEEGKMWGRRERGSVVWGVVGRAASFAGFLLNLWR